MSGLIAIVGRPNVGKSALFNRMVGRRIAIVHDEPGVTRDRISAPAEYRGRGFSLMDTGGIGLMEGEKAPALISRAAYDQVQLALESADSVILVVNVQEGVVPLDREVAQRLRRAAKPVLVAVNKVDTARDEEGVDEFTVLGFESMHPVSAIHDRGIEALMKAACATLPEPNLCQGSRLPDSERAGEPFLGGSQALPLKLAILGRPNVGKSSLINTLVRSERVLVSPLPGTTRDSVDVPFEIQTDGVRQKYILIDTAGMRKARRVGDSVEFFSVKRAENAIQRCDIAVLVLDAEQGLTEQDKKIADKIVSAHKACVMVVNKWDLMEEAVRRARQEAMKQEPKGRKGGRPHANAPGTLAEFGQWVQEQMFFLDYAPVIFTSAKSGFHLARLLEAIRFVSTQLQQQIPTALLNRALQEAVASRPAPSHSGQRLKFFYATQVAQSPPKLLLFVNRPELFSEPYKKYLTTALRRRFGYEGCPLLLVPKARPQSSTPTRKSGPRRPAKKGRAHRAR